MQQPPRIGQPQPQPQPATPQPSSGQDGQDISPSHMCADHVPMRGIVERGGHPSATALAADGES
jgi:hypothetical protein